mmetsp:Transcript_28395/g.59320  ORF Transcript_28395/g.59320 Transcript_28395/m.59320 type:complete len:91 (+) Transcript_28395:291-563(+)
MVIPPPSSPRSFFGGLPSRAKRKRGGFSWCYAPTPHTKKDPDQRHAHVFALVAFFKPKFRKQGVDPASSYLRAEDILKTLSRGPLPWLTW